MESKIKIWESGNMMGKRWLFEVHCQYEKNGKTHRLIRSIESGGYVRETGKVTNGRVKESVVVPTHELSEVKTWKEKATQELMEEATKLINE